MNYSQSNTLGYSGNGTVSDSTRQGAVGLMDEANNHLQSIFGSIQHLNARLQSMSDRAFGSVPRAVGQSKEAASPTGQIAQIGAVIQAINEQVQAAHSTLDTLERITGN